ncbi:hypothetical protein PUNSTDRAFT_133211 [Punctularia strigosozonata HHB-11173 SS5]|uniref:uncharacterized protein n=1 Tax=Punctularia strigosozonata (strain HHB-11173) TaxID=741275 RepID=UPI00044180E6|nr:uncharacterized protein PUNSTDRAFT_133211 [Punctularia strigosozonata HHB-11173 SS5]EIN09421.1 hypothetical protein PUNSTDRAFT_133211 [Punctularia strigosozonata HHB-11173 SS5]
MARTAPREAGSSARPQRTTSPPLEGGEFRAWSPGEDPDDVYPESVEDLQEPSSELFTKDGRPVVFCFYRLTTGQITRVTEQIMVNGGEICPAKHNKRDLCKFGADADVVLAPDTALNHLRTVIYFGSGNPLPEHVGFVRECIQAGKYEHDRLIVRKMPGPPRSNFPRHRNAWTHEDELGLCRYIASVDPYDQGGRCGYEIYKRAIAQHKERGNMPWTTRHSYQSIQEHYRRNEGGLKPMINRFVMQMRPRLDGRGQYERRYVEAIKEEEEEEEGEVEGEVDRSNNDDEETVQRPAKRLRHTAIDLTVSDDDSDSHREQGRGGTASHRGQAPPTAGSSASKSAQVQAEAGSAHENRKSKKKRLRDGHEKRPPVDNIDMADDDQYRPEQEDLRVDFGVDFEDYGAYNELDMQFEAPSTFGLRGQRTGLSPSPSQGAPSTSQVTLETPNAESKYGSKGQAPTETPAGWEEFCSSLRPYSGTNDQGALAFTVSDPSIAFNPC